jgi:hypothetical protein
MGRTRVPELGYPKEGRTDMVTYELWETRSGNLMGSFASEAEALAVVRDAIRQHGRGYAETLILAREDDEETVTLAEGAGLADLAERHARRSGHAVHTA